MKKTTKKNILIAEDDKAISKAVCVLLKSGGYKVSPVLEGEEIMIQAKKIKPNLILLDVMMSGVDGYEICQKMKKDRVLTRIPIIMMSANSNIKKKAKEAGADDFISKPFDISNLMSKIEERIK